MPWANVEQRHMMFPSLRTNTEFLKDFLGRGIRQVKGTLEIISNFFVDVDIVEFPLHCNLAKRSTIADVAFLALASDSLSHGL